MKIPRAFVQAPITTTGLPGPVENAKFDSVTKPLAIMGAIKAYSPASFVNFYIHSGERPKKLYAICRPDIRDNWISLRVVNRLQIESQSYQPVRKAVFDGEVITSTGRFVEVACSGERECDGLRYRFYIAKHPNFDVLLGSRFVPSTSTP